jgi:hypothetical protein
MEDKMKKKQEKSQPATVEQSKPVTADQPAKVDVSKMPVEINGKTYDLCFGFNELAEAERFYQSQGHRFHLLFALPQLTLESLQVVLPCALRAHHPELNWEQARGMVTLLSAAPIALAVVAALDAGTAAA